MAYGTDEDYGEDQRTLEMVFDGMKQSEDALEPLRKTRWPRAHMYYYGVHDLSVFSESQDKYPFESSVFYPTVVQQVETIVPRLAAGLLANDPVFVAKPMLADGELPLRERYEEWAEANGILLHNQLVRDVRIRERLPGWLRDAALYGTKWLYIDWYTRRGTDWRQVPVRGAEGRRWEMKEIKDQLLEDRLRVRGESIWNVFPDPRAGSIEECRYIGRVLTMTVDELWQWIQGTKQSKKWKVTRKRQLDTVKGTARAEDQMERVLQADVARLSSEHGEGWTPRKRDKNLVRVVDWWEPDWHIVVAGRKGMPSEGEKYSSPSEAAKRGEEAGTLLLLRERNPFKKLRIPFVTLRPTPKDGEIFGVGLIDKIGDLVEFVNTMTNLRLTDLMGAVTGITLFNNLAGMYAEDFVLQPRGAYNVDGVQDPARAVHRIDWDVKSSEQWKEVDYAVGQIGKTGGGTDFQMGQAAQGFNETARGIGFLLEQGNAQFNLMVHSLAQDLANLGRSMHSVNQQYITRGRLERTIGPEGAEIYVPVDPEIIQREIDLDFSAQPESANKALQQQQLIHAAEVFSQWPECNRQENIKQFYKLAGFPRPERFVSQTSTDAHYENMRFRGTGTIGAVEPGDNHWHHMEVHKELVHDGTLANAPDHAKRRLLDHVEDHARYAGIYGSQPGEGPPAPGAPPGQGMGGGAAPQGQGGGTIPQSAPDMTGMVGPAPAQTPQVGMP